MLTCHLSPMLHSKTPFPGRCNHVDDERRRTKERRRPKEIINCLEEQTKMDNKEFDETREKIFKEEGEGACIKIKARMIINISKKKRRHKKGIAQRTL